LNFAKVHCVWIESTQAAKEAIQCIVVKLEGGGELVIDADNIYSTVNHFSYANPQHLKLMSTLLNSFLSLCNLRWGKNVRFDFKQNFLRPRSLHTEQQRLN